MSDLIRVGCVSKINYEEGTIEVTYPDRDDAVTDPFPVLSFNDEYKMIQKMYREFAEKEIKPLAEEIDENERFPKESVQKMADNGMLGIPFPEEYGGEEGDYLSYVIAVEELSKVCGTTAVIVSAHTSLCCAPIFEHGTEEQKMK